MTASEWQSVCAEVSASISLRQLDEELEQIPHLTEDERSAIWLYAWASRQAAARVGELALV
jgi:hypothetical protein